MKSSLPGVLITGPPPEHANAAVILAHGRGASAESMTALIPHIGHAGVCYLTPQAPDNTWYPYTFLAPIEQNEPKLSQSLQTIDQIVQACRADGLANERIVLIGFSQGACLTLEYTVRHARRFGAVLGLSGGLIGPPGTEWKTGGSLEKTPVFLGCSDIDFHIPVERVHETAAFLEKVGGEVTTKIYPGMGHTINEDEVDHINIYLAHLLSPAS